jgi:pimeloyl-ACP methyl ester carboxylesterase
VRTIVVPPKRIDIALGVVGASVCRDQWIGYPADAGVYLEAVKSLLSRSSIDWRRQQTSAPVREDDIEPCYHMRRESSMASFRSAAAAAFLVLALTAPLSTRAQTQNVPRFERVECSLAARASSASIRTECGNLIVAQVRGRPASGTLRLAVVIVHPVEQSGGPPLVLLHGGPSGPGGIGGAGMGLAWEWAPRLKRDVIVYDQRGAGRSEPRLCPEVVAQGNRARNLRTREERESVWNEDARACVASLRAEGVEPTAFNSATNAADLIDLRTALGHKSWDVYGVSYGSRLAQEAMRRDPDGVRAAVMLSPNPTVPIGQASSPLSFQRTIDRVFAACAAQPACARAFPSLESDFAEIYQEFNARPIELAAEASPASTIHVDGDRLVRALRSGFAARVPRIPLFIHELRRGDRRRALRALVGDPGRPAPTEGNVLSNLVGCYDNDGETYRETLASIAAQLRAPFRGLLRETDGDCSPWLDRFADPSDHSVVLSAIPTLILTPEFDHLNSAEFARRIASGLKTAYVFDTHGRHGQLTACSMSMILSFLEQPMRAPDAACLTTEAPLVFETGKLQPTMLVMVVTSADRRNSSFIGRWESAISLPVGYTANFRIAGNQMTGSFDAAQQTFPIFDGRVDGNTIAFKVMSPDNDRTITFTGTLEGETITFTRDVAIRPGGAPGGAALFGAGAARTFTAILSP